MDASNIAKLFLICVLSCLYSVSLAQSDYWGPDTNKTPPEIETYDEALNHVFGNLNDNLTTNILLDRSYDISANEKFDGHTLEDTARLEDFWLSYTEFTDALISDEKTMNFMQIDSMATMEYLDHDMINIGIYRYKYNAIRQEAKDAGYVYWDDYQLRAKQEATADLFDESESTMLMPLVESYMTNGSITYIVDYQYLFTNTGQNPIAIAIDFDDGNGMRLVTPGQPIEVYYGDEGFKTWTYLLHYSDGEVRQGVSSIRVFDEDPSIEYECGYGFSVSNDKLLRDMPQETVNISAPAAIENPKNDNKSTVSGELGIYFGCGNSSCEIRKPLICVSGYGPDIDLIAPQKRLIASKAKGMLYNHFNGAYGVDAPSGLYSGSNNGTNLLYRLRNEGFDIVIVYFDNGVDYVQNHAELVKKTIEYVNHQKAMNGSKHENVIMGQSMGGISSRYALASWEQQFMQENSDPYMHHQCRTWISWDGEMQGATIPLGMQFNSWYLTSRLPTSLGLAFFGAFGGLLGGSVSALLHEYVLKNALENVAAKSILTYHYSLNGGTNGTLNKTPENLVLFQELDLLGYPEQVRRVAISDGSSTAQIPSDVSSYNSSNYGGECLLDIELGLGDNTAIGVNVNTEKVGTNQRLFRAGVHFFGLPLPYLSEDVKKNYQRAESVAPGSYERFHKSFVYSIAKFTLGDCKKPNYRATFVPTTSAFDIQDDESVDFGYNMVDNDLYWVTNEDQHPDFGYPHIKNQQSKTPFNAVFSNPENQFHLQNPGLDMAQFILSEISSDNLFLQNKLLGGNQNSIYSAKYESRESISIGRDVSVKYEVGDFTISQYTNVDITSPYVSLRNGFKATNGSKVKIQSLNSKPEACFLVNEPNNLNKTDFDSKRGNHAKNSRQINDVPLKIIPNPGNGIFSINDNSMIEGSRVYVFDIQGSVFLETSYKNRQSKIDISKAPSGVYFIQVVSPSKSFSSKYIKL